MPTDNAGLCWLELHAAFAVQEANKILLFRATLVTTCEQQEMAHMLEIWPDG